MSIDTQSFPLKSLSGPIDNAAIVLRLSLFVSKFQQKDLFDFLFFSRFYLQDVQQKVV